MQKGSYNSLIYFSWKKLRILKVWDGIGAIVGGVCEGSGATVGAIWKGIGATTRDG